MNRTFRMTRLRFLAISILLAGLAVTNLHAYQAEIQNRYQLSEDGHHVVAPNGETLYWIGDTAWAMFQRLTREEIDAYLDDRKQKGFTVIQSVIYWYPHGPFEPIGPSNEKNAYGHRPFGITDGKTDTSRPFLTEGGSVDAPNDYWDHVDYVMNATRERGFTFVVLPCWGNAYINNRMDRSEIEFDEPKAREYGRFLGTRYASQSHVIWCMGGDVDPVNFADKDQRAVYRAMAEGIGQGVSRNRGLRWNVEHPDWNKSFMTFHAVRTPKQSGSEGGSSSTWFHEDAWLDFNMMETFRWTHQIHPLVSEDYRLKPTKPTLLGEGAYELGKYGNECGYISALKVRRQGYHAFFAGSAGYTYGCWAIWAFRGEYCETTWQQALNLPGATQVGQVMREFVEQQEVFSYEPAQQLILSENPGGELLQCVAIKKDRSSLMVYLPDRRSVRVNTRKLDSARRLTVEWFDPRDGTRKGGSVSSKGVYKPPKNWEDAILIIAPTE